MGLLDWQDSLTTKVVLLTISIRLKLMRVEMIDNATFIVNNKSTVLAS